MAEIKYQWAILFTLENTCSYILFPSSIKEFVLELVCPDKSEGVSPKYIDIAISDNAFKEYGIVSEYISEPGGIIIPCLPLKVNKANELIFISPVPWDAESAIDIDCIIKSVLPNLFDNFNLSFSPDVDIWMIWRSELYESSLVGAAVDMIAVPHVVKYFDSSKE